MNFFLSFFLEQLFQFFLHYSYLSICPTTQGQFLREQLVWIQKCISPRPVTVPSRKIPVYLTDWWRRDEFTLSPNILVRSKTQTDLSKIWTYLADSSSYAVRFRRFYLILLFAFNLSLSLSLSLCHHFLFLLPPSLSLLLLLLLLLLIHSFGALRRKYLIKTLLHRLDATQGKLLSDVRQFWIQFSF